MGAFRGWWLALVGALAAASAPADELPLPHPAAGPDSEWPAALPELAGDFASPPRPIGLGLGLVRLGAAPAPFEPLVPEPPLRLGERPRELVEGVPATFGWVAGGVVYSVAVTAAYELIGAGGPGGRRAVILAEPSTSTLGGFTWDVPGLDTTQVTLKVKGFARDARVVALEEWTVPFRPARMVGKLQDGIYVALRGPGGQRLYLQRDGKLVLAARCSGAAGARTAGTGYHPRAPHDHLGVFRVTSRAVSHRSSLNEDWLMRWVLRYHGGHAVHATTRGYYRLLGRPASHGCVRLHLSDARRLYSLCGLGTRVEIF